MIILSAGMPRAGSGWYYNLTNDLVIAAGYQDGRKIRQQYRLGHILTEVNCNIGALTPRRLLPVMIPSVLGNTFVVKAHAGPTPLALRMISLNMIRPAYIYRDPRDAMLSAYEYGRRAVERGRPNAFSHLTDFQASLEFILEYLKIWEKWITCKDVLQTRYEELKSNYEVESGRLVTFLGLDGDNPTIQQVIERHRPEHASRNQKGSHFSTGVSGRFREKYTLEEQAIVAEKLDPYLRRMGYE